MLKPRGERRHGTVKQLKKWCVAVTAGPWGGDEAGQVDGGLVESPHQPSVGSLRRSHCMAFSSRE